MEKASWLAAGLRHVDVGRQRAAAEGAEVELEDDGIARGEQLSALTLRASAQLFNFASH